jgi:hypothetical protein
MESLIVDDLERIRKEAALSGLRYCPSICLEEENNEN